MNDMLTISFLTLISSIIVYALLSVRLFLRLRRVGPSPVLVFLLFGVANFLVSELYWLSHIFITRENTIVFAAVEVAETGACLCFASSLRTALGEDVGKDRRILLEAIAFMACNTAFWIAWTGGWVKDMMSGAAMCYLFYTCMLGAKCYKLFPHHIRSAFVTGAILIFSLQTAALLIGGDTGALMDNLCAPIWLLGIAYFMFRIIPAVRGGGDTLGRGTMALTYTGLVWCLCAMYLSFEPFYFVPTVFQIFMVVMMVLAAEKEVAGK
ncbi:MAG: hypothetical protein IJG63_08510 [Oscillospiraceae bacterium]|nr:hypothetical protein [Oscillospiraceae bacterium]